MAISRKNKRTVPDNRGRKEREMFQPFVPDSVKKGKTNKRKAMQVWSKSEKKEQKRAVAD